MTEAERPYPDYDLRGLIGWYEPESEAFVYRRARELIHFARIPREAMTDEVVEQILSVLNGETPEGWRERYPGVDPSTPIGEENQEETAT
jgi:hypothetical protein